MNAITRLSSILLIWLGLVPFAAAQSAPFRYQLLSLLPDDFAVCIVVHDLRGHSARWERSDWLKSFRASPIGKSLLDAPEMKQFTQWESDMKKHFGLDWPTVRDDILGDTLVLSYSPGPKINPKDEHGLFLLHVRKPERFVQFIDKLNAAQQKSGEVKLTELRYKGQTYQHRKEKDKSQYYIIKDSLVAVATQEKILQAFLDREESLDRRALLPKENLWAKRFHKAGADSAFITMCVNPRMLDAEVLQDRKKDDPFPGYWRALEAIFVTASIRDDAELRLSIQADPAQMPKWAKAAFTQTAPTSSLWQRFPEQSILTITSHNDFAGAADALKLLMSEKDRKKLTSDWQPIGLLLRLDPFKDILPNIGPDWGVCVLPSKDAKQLPQAIFALAVKAGSKEQPTDKMLFKGIEMFAGIAVLDHNKKNPNAPIRLQSVMQDKIEVKYLTNDKLFPPGFQPACALKDGFLIFATTPDAILNFRLHDKKPDTRKGAPLARVSAPELARLLEHRREHILTTLAEQKMPAATAKRNLENVIGLLGLFDQLTLSLDGGDGQATFSLRLTPTTKR
jgi:hypothetical protein